MVACSSLCSRSRKSASPPAWVMWRKISLRFFRNLGSLVPEEKFRYPTTSSSRERFSDTDKAGEGIAIEHKRVKLRKQRRGFRQNTLQARSPWYGTPRLLV